MIAPLSLKADIVEKLSQTNVFSRERNSNNLLATIISLSVFEATFLSNHNNNLIKARPSFK